MVIALAPLPPVSSDYGYTQQCWLKTQIDRECFGDKPWIWFSTDFGAWSNVDSSNPCSRYYNLSRAVELGDVGSILIKDLRFQMLINIDRFLPPSDAKAAKARVALAALTEFRTKVWRLDLNQIAISRRFTLPALKAEWLDNARQQVMTTPGQTLQPDEFLIKDLQQTGSTVEYEVIIER